MLDSALNILKHFAPESTLRFNFDYFEIVRADAEEVFYLVAIHRNWFVVFETDYIMNIHRTYDEAVEIFGEDFAVEGWVGVNTPGATIDPKISKQSEKELILAIAFDNPENHLRYAVIKLAPREPITLSGPAHGELVTSRE
jgi:hypothetical protein